MATASAVAVASNRVGEISAYLKVVRSPGMVVVRVTSPGQSPLDDNIWPVWYRDLLESLHGAWYDIQVSPGFVYIYRPLGGDVPMAMAREIAALIRPELFDQWVSGYLAAQLGTA